MIFLGCTASSVVSSEVLVYVVTVSLYQYSGTHFDGDGVSLELYMRIYGHKNFRVVKHQSFLDTRAS